MEFQLIEVISRTIFLAWIGMCPDMPDEWQQELPYEPTGRIRSHTVHDGVSYCSISYEALELPDWVLGYNLVKENSRLREFDSMRLARNNLALYLWGK